MGKLLDEALKAIQKKVPEAAEFESTIGGITTGSLAVDIITGVGGFPAGRISEVFGWEASGKTTLCMSACAAAERMGIFWVYVDIENGVDPVLASHIGMTLGDKSKGLYVRPSTFEQTMEIIELIVSSGEAPLAIVDSVPAMTPENVFEGALADGTPIGLMARKLAETLPRLAKLVLTKKCALVFVNQMRKKVNTGPSWMARKEDIEESSGGSALKFYSSLRLDMRFITRTEKMKRTDLFTGKDIEVPTANIHEAYSMKNKVARPYLRAQFQLRYDEGRYGVDHLFTLIGIGIAGGVILRRGSHFSMSHEGVAVNANGGDALYDHFAEHQDAREALTNAVLQLEQVRVPLARQLQP